MELKTEGKSLNEKVARMDRILDRHEQYSRRNCLLIHYAKENKEEYTDEVITEILEKKMEEKVLINDIDRSHQVGKKHTKSKSRLIISNFVTYNVPNAIFRKKKVIIGKTAVITENLTKKRIIEMKKAQATHGFENVSSQDGEILYTDANHKNEIIL